MKYAVSMAYCQRFEFNDMSNFITLPKINNISKFIMSLLRFNCVRFGGNRNKSVNSCWFTLINTYFFSVPGDAAHYSSRIMISKVSIDYRLYSSSFYRGAIWTNTNLIWFYLINVHLRFEQWSPLRRSYSESSCALYTGSFPTIWKFWYLFLKRFLKH